jgi:endonuclease/exonuclease/phosphatase family metal-dependent hydrolase
MAWRCAPNAHFAPPDHPQPCRGGGRQRKVRTALRLATFNIENLDVAPKSEAAFQARAAVLRPALDRIAADILCLQEVNGQHVPGATERRLVALELLLKGTRYKAYQRAATSGSDGHGAASVTTSSRCHVLRSGSSARFGTRT